MHSHAYVLSIQYILIHLNCLGLFWLFLSPSLSSVCVSLLLWHPNANLLCPRTLFVLGHPLLPILLPHMSSSMMRRPNQTSLRTFLDEAFILNTKSFCRTSSTLTFPLSFTVGNGNHCVTSWSHVHPCWSKSFTPTIMNLIFQYLTSLLAFSTHIIVTPEIVFNVLRVPRVEHPDYLSYDHLKTISKDELIYAFCKCPSDWGKRQITYCLGFAKGSWFLNMVITFVLHPLSHYSSITESRA